MAAIQTGERRISTNFDPSASYEEQLERARLKLYGYNVLAVTGDEESPAYKLAMDLGGLEIDDSHEDLSSALRASSMQEQGRRVASVLPLQVIGGESIVYRKSGCEGEEDKNVLTAIRESKSTPIVRVHVPTEDGSSHVAVAIVSNLNGELI